MNKHILLISYLTLTWFMGFSQWNQISPIPTNAYLTNICFSEDGFGLSVGFNGTIIHSNDFGVSWQDIISGINDNLYDVCFSSNATAFIVGESGTLLKSVDGGLSWIGISMPDSIRLSGICFTDSLCGWIVGGYSGGFVFNTTDGGNTWQLQSTIENNDLSSVCFVDRNNGWATGYNGILSSSDGGNNWNYQFSGDYINLNRVTFSDTLNGWSVGDYLILHTIDGGINWNVDTFYMVEMGGLLDIGFFNENTGFIAGGSNNLGNSHGFLLETNDGGMNWDYTANVSGQSMMTALWINDQYKGCAVGAYGNILFTDNAGNDWEQKSGVMNDLYLIDIQFPSPEVGYIVADVPYLVEYSRIAKTINGGQDWNIIVNNFFGWVDCIFMLDDNNGWVCSSYGLWKTVDGGLSWEMTGHPWSGYGCNDLLFTDAQNGWLVDRHFLNSKIYHSSDGGANWTVQYDAVDSYIKELYFLDENIGWGLGVFYGGNGYSEAFSISTADGGMNWNIQLNQEFTEFLDVYFTDNDHGVIIEQSGMIYNTSDGGDTWGSVNSKIPDTCTDAFFIDMDIVWMVGSEGRVYYTNDRGQNWIIDVSITSADLRTVIFTSPENGFILGEKATLLMTDNGGIGSIGNSQEQAPVVLQCYPNPSSGAVHLRYSIFDTRYSMFEVYSTDGILVKSQSVGKQPAGEYTMDLDLGDLPDGIYFIRLHAGEMFETAKIILLR